MSCGLQCCLMMQQPLRKHRGLERKTAQKLILELKDKFSLEEAFQSKLSHVQEKECRQYAGWNR